MKARELAASVSTKRIHGSDTSGVLESIRQSSRIQIAISIVRSRVTITLSLVATTMDVKV